MSASGDYIDVALKKGDVSYIEFECRIKQCLSS